jgi:ABC-type transporter Mla MlaB component
MAMEDSTNRPDSRQRPGSVEVELDVSWLVEADVAAIDALARLQVAAHRCGCSLRLHGAPPSLVEVLELIGLAEIMPICDCPSGCAPHGSQPAAAEPAS